MIMEQLLIDKLDRCLLKGNPILFTGAGFSKGAKNAYSINLPSGQELKEEILVSLLQYKKSESIYQSLMEESLAAICEYAENETSKNRLQDFIADFFRGCQPMPYHIEIANFEGWKKVYTTNIDDLFENAIEQGRLVVQNMRRPIEYSRGCQLEYIKLHGCVNNPSESFVFSSNQYIDSMLQSRDYRFNSFGNDIQYENFVLIGTDWNEINLRYYLNLFESVHKSTAHGQLFFINPAPTAIFQSRVERVGGHIVKWTTEEFAIHLRELLQNSGNLPNKRYKIEEFLNINEVYNKKKVFKGYKSYLYFGRNPIYEDIIFDWDFQNPEINTLISDTINYFTDEGAGKRMMVAFSGKSLSGKSVYLKRFAVELVKEDFQVYEFCGKDFDVNNFCMKCKHMSEKNISVIFDNASFYYSEIRILLEKFPRDKNLLVVTTARTLPHTRKRYCLVDLPEYTEMPILGETAADDGVFAENIVSKLGEKGLLGHIKSKTFESQVRYVVKFNDVESCLYSITNGETLRKKQIESFYKDLKDHKISQDVDYMDLLRIAAIFHKLDLPYVPYEVVGLMFQARISDVLSDCENYITSHGLPRGLSLRDTYLVSDILNETSRDAMRVLLEKFLISISPQVLDSAKTYWDEMASTLMKGKLLRSILHMPNADVKNLLASIKPYYDENYNYWIQVGLAEQHDSEYEMALNHFRQAESMSPKSYLVRNAIARNYLRQANEEEVIDKASALHDEGVSKMKALISDSEKFQVKAYSTHCLLFENVRYFRRFNIKPSSKVLGEMFEMLKSIVEKDPDGVMTKHISNVFNRFLQDKNLTSSLPKMSMYDIRYLQPMLEPEDMPVQEILENFEIE